MANLMPCFLCQRMPTAITINSGGGGHGPWLHLCEFCGERLYVAFSGTGASRTRRPSRASRTASPKCTTGARSSARSSRPSRTTP